MFIAVEDETSVADVPEPSDNVSAALEVWEEHLIFRGPDKRLRQEISDQKIRLTNLQCRPFAGGPTLGDCLEHAELFGLGRYSKLQAYSVTYERAQRRTEACAFNPSARAIKFNTQYEGLELLEGLVLHEVQHMVQHIADFARGGNLELDGDRYDYVLGEVEADLTATRAKWNMDRRRCMPPWETGRWKVAEEKGGPFVSTWQDLFDRE